MPQITGEYRRRVSAWNSGCATWRDLDFLFGLDNGYPQFSGLEAVGAILSLGRRKWVPAHVARLDVPSESAQSALEDILSSHRYYDSDHNQGTEKIMALHWLKGRGARELVAEGDYAAGRYDVASEDLGVVVECGTTRMDKFLTTAMSNDWREFVLVPRCVKLAIVFTLTRRPFDRIRSIGEHAHDQARYLERVCQETQITKSSLARCVTETNDAFLEKYRKAAESLRGRFSPTYSFS